MLAGVPPALPEAFLYFLNGARVARVRYLGSSASSPSLSARVRVFSPVTLRETPQPPSQDFSAAPEAHQDTGARCQGSFVPLPNRKVCARASFPSRIHEMLLPPLQVFWARACVCQSSTAQNP